jgi:hypothetical protein
MYFLYCVINTVFAELILHCSVTIQSFNRQPFGTLKGIPDIVVSLNKLPVHLLNVQRNVVFCETCKETVNKLRVFWIPNSILFSFIEVTIYWKTLLYLCQNLTSHICIHVSYYSKYLFCALEYGCHLLLVSSPLCQYKYINKNFLVLYFWNMKPDDSCLHNLNRVAL